MRIALRISRAGVTALAIAVSTAAVHAQSLPAPLPLKYAGPPTSAPISAGDLMTRLYIFADDSMYGRLAGDVGLVRATAYIERTVRALALTPAGDSGTYFQAVASLVPPALGGRKPVPPRNVIAILPGSDPALRGQYIVIGAHSDHIGMKRPAVDHDSIHVYNEIARPQGLETPPLQQPLSPDVWKRIRARIDSLHKAHGVRRDSVYNGADDDGSGSVSVLELAEAFAKGESKPRRSILFVWHAGEEEGMVGSTYFTDHPTVPRDSIVAELNMDMIGRGGASDLVGVTDRGAEMYGGPGYLQLIGSRRLSTELGDIIEAINSELTLGFKFDYSFDANGHPQMLYCRSDHAAYARYGIPIAFFTTGGHADYHQLSDEPQYIDYQRMAHVDSLVFGTALRLANLDHRLVVDKPKPNPGAPCKQ